METNIGKKVAAVFCAAVLLSVYTSNAAGVPLTEGSGADARDEIQESYAETVDPFIGTGGAGLAAGFVYPGATRPFGMVQFTPTYFARRGGFVINQLSGAGCRHMGNFPTLPVAGALEESPAGLFANRVRITGEKGHAGYYEASVDEGIKAELSVTERTGMARYTFPERGKGTVLIGGGIAATPVSQAAICITGPSSCEGYAEGGNFCGVRTPYKVYFVAEFDARAQETGIWKGDRLVRGASFAEGEGSGVYFTFSLEDGDVIQYKIGVSYVSVENARENLRAENPGWSFTSVKEAAESAWDMYLGKIETAQIEGNVPFKGKNAVMDHRSISFDYLAESLPYPLDTVPRGPGAARCQANAMKMVPFMEEMNQEILKVTGLEGKYELLIDGQPLGVWDAGELAKGINMAELTWSPQYQQALQVMYLNEWRWELERSFRDYAWMQYGFLKPLGCLDLNDRRAVEAIDRHKSGNIWAGIHRDTYARLMYKDVRDTRIAEMDMLTDKIYQINKPVEHRISLRSK